MTVVTRKDRLALLNHDSSAVVSLHYSLGKLERVRKIRFAKHAVVNPTDYGCAKVVEEEAPIINKMTHKLSRVLNLEGSILTISYDQAALSEGERASKLAEFILMEKKRISQKKSKMIEAGIVFAGKAIKTTPTAIALIHGTGVKDLPSRSFKTNDGIIQLNPAQMAAIREAVHDHVQKCYDREAELLAFLDDIETAEEFDSALIALNNNINIGWT